MDGKSHRVSLSFPARFAIACLLLVLAAYQARPRSQTAPAVTSPREQFGAAIGDDYFLASYAQFEDYWKRLDAESDRVRVVPIGATVEGRTQWMAIVSSPENLANLDRYRDISRRLALADGLTDDDARRLAESGKAIVWIDGGLHADEVLGVQQLIETVYQLANASDAETLRVLRDVIVLAVHANPDGHALVGDWYMRERDPRRRTVSGLPRLYHRYAGHDLNRDFYLASQPETINMNRVLYREWFPQIVYDHHQPGPPGTVMFAPPFGGPVNHVFDPLVLPSIELLGAAMHARFAAEGKAGVTMRGGSTYSMWWNGGLRTTAYFHNQIGLLTETIGSPTPGEIPFVAARQVPSVDLPHPIAPGPWRFRQSVEYSISANRAVLDAASRYRETLLVNAYRMGRNSIERGSGDSGIAPPRSSAAGDEPRRPAPRLYVLPADQPDFLTATKFVDALLKAGVTVHRATRTFPAAGRNFPAGSYVVRTAQAFRPHIVDMFEAQEHSDDRSIGGGAAEPYDITGWTLAFQMGVRFDRIFDSIDGPFEALTEVTVPAGVITGAAKPVGYLIAHHQNDAFLLVNRLLKNGEPVWWLRDRTIGSSDGTGSIYVSTGPDTASVLQQAARELGVSANGVASVPQGEALRLRPVRVGLWDRYGGSTTSGWIRWILERFEFPFELVFAQQLDAGQLAERFDVLIFPDDAVPGRREPEPEGVPEEFRQTTGAISRSRTVPQLKAFVERGGTVIAIGDATVLVESLVPGISNGLAGSARGDDGSGRAAVLIPGSLLRASVDNRVPLGYGFAREVDMMFDRSPVFAASRASRGLRQIAWFGDEPPLRSGFARGQQHLRGRLAIVEAEVGSGRVLLVGPEITFRAQPHGTFKFLFNGIHSSRAVPVARISTAEP
jgi:hypothetical protein